MDDRSPPSLCVQKFPTDKAYFIAKELLTTERTYLKDLQVITEVRKTVLLFLFSSRSYWGHLFGSLLLSPCLLPCGY